MYLDPWITPAAVIVILALITLVFKIGSWHGDVNSDRSTFKKFMEKIKEDLRIIKKDLKGLLKYRSDPAVTNDSPLRLTELERSISNNLNASEWASRVAESNKNSVGGMDAYAIQEFSFDYADDEQHYTEDEIQAIRENAYANGLTDSQVRRIMGIELRDILLHRHQ